MRAKERRLLKKQSSFHQCPVTIFEGDRPRTVPEEFKITEEARNDNDEARENQNQETQQNNINNNNTTTTTNNKNSSSNKRKPRGLSPMSRSPHPLATSKGRVAQLPLSVECFIVSRGWQIDQSQLNKAIGRLEGINFVRIQMANTINRVIENIRPHNDVVLLHIGTTELSEACHSINSEESVQGECSKVKLSKVKLKESLSQQLSL